MRGYHSHNLVGLFLGKDLYYFKPYPIILLTMMVREYIVLAAGCVAAGVVITFVVIGVCVRVGIDISKDLWVLGIPAVLSVTLNVILLELYRKFWKKK